MNVLRDNWRLIRNFLLAVLVVLLLQTGAEWIVMEAKVNAFIQAVESGERVRDPYHPDKPIHREGEDWIGSYGDIPLTYEAIHPVVQFFVGGHLGVVEDERRVIESSGLEAMSKNIVKYWPNTWKRRYDHVILLRVHGATDEEYHQALENARDLLGRQYDFLFTPFSRWIYCSEVPGRAWAPLGYNLNYDGLWITPNDVLISPHTYIVYVQYRDREGNLQVWSLDDSPSTEPRDNMTD